ncbi:MAG TPA: helix-hairpin-helix domain-containing protein [Tissierellales bacterium]|nr:helix-hairpin-helix domain-containing protein [Tissierellales bacterium]
MTFFTKREQIVILFIVVLVVVISLLGIFKKDTKDQPSISKETSTNNNTDNDDEIHDDEKEESSNIIMVHISGEVSKPGLVELKNGSRLIDAVNEAGGLKDNADLDKINLAKKLEDEEKIYIPKIGEEDIDDNNNSNSSGNDDKININTASKEELMTLPGMGEVLTDRIIQYRENNQFNSIEDIQNVSGIGPKKFEGIEEFIKVD